MVRRSVAGLLMVDFFVEGYRISGYINTRTYTVADHLNDRLKSYLELGDVYISRISNPGEIVAAYGKAELRKENLLFAIVPARERFAQAGRSVSFFGRHRLGVWMALPSFEIEGDLQLAGLMSTDLEVWLTKEGEEFIPVVDGVARATIHSDITFGGEAFLVNKRHVDLICLGEEKT